MSSAAEVDRAILFLVRSQWLKVARIVAMTPDQCSKDAGEITYEFAAERIAALVAQGRLELQGNLANWRRSEIRRTQSPST